MTKAERELSLRPWQSFEQSTLVSEGCLANHGQWDKQDHTQAVEKEVCVTLNSPSSQSGARRCYILAHFDSAEVAPLVVRHLFVEVGVHVFARSRLLESSLGLLIWGVVRREVAAAAAVQDHSRTSELFIWPSDPYRVTRPRSTPSPRHAWLRTGGLSLLSHSSVVPGDTNEPRGPFCPRLTFVTYQMVWVAHHPVNLLRVACPLRAASVY